MIITRSFYNILLLTFLTPLGFFPERGFSERGFSDELRRMTHQVFAERHAIRSAPELKLKKLNMGKGALAAYGCVEPQSDRAPLTAAAAVVVLQSRTAHCSCSSAGACSCGSFSVPESLCEFACSGCTLGFCMTTYDHQVHYRPSCRLNKYILDPRLGGYPFPLALTAIHMAFCSSVAWALVKLRFIAGPELSFDVYQW